MSSTTRLAMGLAGAVGVLLVMELAPGLQRLFDPVNLLLAHAVEYLLVRMDMPVMRNGTVLMHPDGFGYRIDYVCSGFRPAALIAVTILVVRVTWVQRIVGILVALAFIEALNVGRLVHLFWLGVHQPEAFFVAHRVVWNVGAVGAGLAYLGIWLCLSGSRIGAEDRALARGACPDDLQPGNGDRGAGLLGALLHRPRPQFAQGPMRFLLRRLPRRRTHEDSGR
jgi:exosortase/archaeosortase family protein